MKPDNMSVYLVVPGVGGRRHREDMLTKMEGLFSKLTLISYMESDPFHNHIKVDSPSNPTTLFARIGLPGFKKFLDKYVYFPSSNMPRAKSGELVLDKCIEKDLGSGLDVCVLIYTPPHDFAISGYRLKKRYPDIRLLVDWQDLWSFDETYFLRVPAFFRRRLLNIEKKIFKVCDLNIVTNFKAAKILEDHYGLARNRISSIPHPFDPNERAELSRQGFLDLVTSKGVIKIGFLGGISKPPKVRGDKLLATIDRLVESGLPLELHIFGGGSPLTREVVRGLKNGDQIVMHRWANHMDSMKAISSCDFLMISLADLPNSNAIMHSKLAHYLILNRPILALVPKDSFVAHVINETGTGVVIFDESDWDSRLQIVFQSYLDGTFAVERKPEAIEQYSWEQLSVKWLNAICGSN